MAIKTSKRSTGLWKRRGRRRARRSHGTSNLTDTILRQVCRDTVSVISAAKRRPRWLALAAVTAAALVAMTACDQGFSVASSPEGGGSRPTPGGGFQNAPNRNGAGSRTNSNRRNRGIAACRDGGAKPALPRPRLRRPIRPRQSPLRRLRRLSERSCRPRPVLPPQPRRLPQRSRPRQI